jgi:hypothetical protein
MNPQRLRHCPRLEVLEDRLCPSSTVVLPIASFLGAQGQPNNYTYQGAMYSSLTPPVPDELTFLNSPLDPGATSSDPTRLIMIDYTGRASQYLLQHGINLHTQSSGFVTETTIGTSGLMEVSVNLEVRNALTWVAEVPPGDLFTPAINTDPLELGYRPQDLVANPNLKPALSNIHFQLTFQQGVGQPLPDLFQAIFAGTPGVSGSPPAGFAPERVDVQSWGTGTLNTGTTEGTPGQTAIVSTWQVADFTNPNLPGTHADGFWQEPIDILPVASAATHVAYLNGTLFVSDTADGNDHVGITPAAGGGVTVSSNLGSGTYAHVNRVVVALSSGNHDVQIGDLPGATVDVVTFDGNSHISTGAAARLAIHVGGGNNHISTADTNPAAQFIFVGGHGNNQIDVANSTAAEIVVVGNGNNRLSVSGAGDVIEVLGNGNNRITDTGTNDLIGLGGDGNNDIDNQGHGSFTEILAGTGHNHILGPWGFAP